MKVNVRAAIELEETRHLTGDEVPIRDGHLIDKTGSIKLTLWREYSEIESGKTYEFLHLMKLKYAGEVVLQSVNTTTYTVSAS